MVVHKTSHSLSMSYLAIIYMVGILWIGDTLVELANQNSSMHTHASPNYLIVHQFKQLWDSPS
jgi:hypothetical protein